MANVLKMTMVEAIHSLRSAGLSCREIARRLGIHREPVWLFSAPGVRPPLWFRKYRWPAEVTHVTSKCLPAGVAIRARDFGGFSLLAFAPERAILECLLLAPDRKAVDHVVVLTYQVVGGVVEQDG